jgi:DNA polymerase/3'-5' exonuclease PolX
MSSPTSAMPLWLAESAALELQRLLQPVCERVAVAGSVRRRAQVCNDVEVVCIPKIEQATPPGELLPAEVDRLDELGQLIARGDHHLLRRPTVGEGHRAPAWGPKQKKVLLRHQGRWLKCELWITTRRQWGCIYAIRTGDAEFSKGLVTQEIFGGAMPRRLQQAGGELQHFQDGAWQPLYIPEERDFFEALGLPVLNPEERNRTNLTRLLAERAAREFST